MSNCSLLLKKGNQTFDWGKLPISKKIRIMFKKQHYSKDEFSNDCTGLYFVYLDNVMYVNDRPFPQVGYSNYWNTCSKKGASFVFLKIGFTNNESGGKSIYLTILNFGLWCRW